MNKRKYFGTDGIRGKVGENPMTPDFVMKLGWAIGTALQNGHKKVVIGKDTRISGYMLESALEAGLSAAGVDILLLGPMPTPGVAYLTKTLRADAGIVISASHNPYYDNGIKIFSGDGKKLSDEVELSIEKLIESPRNVAKELGKAERVNGARERYIEFCKGTVSSNLSLKGLKIVVDCANGATYQIAPNVFEELGAEVITIGASPNGLNINENCGATSPLMLRSAVIKNEADMGIALDGDGDRLIMVDNNGKVVDGDEILYIIATSYKVRNELQGAGVVGTQMTNLGIEQAFHDFNIPFKRAKVGDRYVLELLKENDWFLGGEGSGHIICLDKTTTGDGIVSALQVLEKIKRTGNSLSELCQEYVKFPQVLVNVRVSQNVDLQDERIQSAVRMVEDYLGSDGRVLLRASGTEPLIRVMVEGKNIADVKRLANQIADVIKEI